MLSAAAARPGLGDFGWALLALMTAPDLVAGTRERNLRGDRCQRVNGPIRETTEVGISCGFHAGNPNGRVAARQGGGSQAGLAITDPPNRRCQISQRREKSGLAPSPRQFRDRLAEFVDFVGLAQNGKIA